MGTSSGSISVELPNGREATLEEMHVYGRTLQYFIREQEAALPLLKDTIRHNQIIDYLRLLADGYNEQLRLYKTADTQRQQLLVAMIRIVGG